MQKLLDILNELSEKYNFEEADIQKIQKAVFEIENGEDEMMNGIDDFVEPEEDDGNETHIEED
jgi:hypothetical protein